MKDLMKKIGLRGERILFFALLCSCSQGDALLPDSYPDVLQLLSVSLDDGALTRSAEVTSVQKISIYTTKAATNAAYGSNPLAVYELSGGAWSAAANTAPIITDNAKVYGFYPAGSNVTNSSTGNHTVPVQVKQTDTFAGTQPDYLYAIPANTTSANHSVSLTMNHVLGKVSFKVNKASAATETLTLEKIEIVSPTNRLQAGDGSMNISTGILNGLVTTSSIVLTGAETLHTQQVQPNVSCLIAPMNGQESVLSFRLTVKVSGESTSRTFVTKAMTPVQWKAGNHYVYSVKVDKMSASLTGISVDKWNTDANQTTSIGI